MIRPKQSYGKTIAQFAGNVTTTVTIPGSEILEALSFYVTYVADANAANRFISILLKDENNNIHYRFISPAVTANQTRDFSIYNGATQNTTVINGTFLAGMPPSIILNNSWKIVIQASGGLAGDTVDVNYNARNYPVG